MSLCVQTFHSIVPSSSSSSSAYVSALGKTAYFPKVLCPILQPQFSRTLTVAHKFLFGAGAGPTRSGISSIRCFSALTPQLKTTLDKVVTSNKVVLFMKGTKEFPQCGFSNTVVQILNSFNVPFETVNILENELLRQGLKEYSNWPTFPQLYIEGEFFGGCDITVEAYQSGQLQELLEKAMCS
ncbi:Monothiol glutaredoxin-related [Quillaja saponaria]|uniref:Monothiol glutaredoxin-related n=1 Tax=Quillaja saponaria TaxID=32244 RepID=A0AAD7QBI1_QUISA|nr:Monothiol glutaredoxin-related [Quillaja saponaria]